MNTERERLAAAFGAGVIFGADNETAPIHYSGAFKRFMDTLPRVGSWCCYIDPVTKKSCEAKPVNQIEHAPWGPCDNTQSCPEHTAFLLPDLEIPSRVIPIEKN